MSKHETFNFKTLEEIQDKIKELGVEIKLDSDFSPLFKPRKIGNKIAHTDGYVTNGRL